jgi:hypothetical protein
VPLRSALALISDLATLDPPITVNLIFPYYLATGDQQALMDTGLAPLIPFHDEGAVPALTLSRDIRGRVRGRIERGAEGEQRGLRLLMLAHSLSLATNFSNTTGSESFRLRNCLTSWKYAPAAMMCLAPRSLSRRRTAPQASFTSSRTGRGGCSSTGSTRSPQPLCRRVPPRAVAVCPSEPLRIHPPGPRHGQVLPVPGGPSRPLRSEDTGLPRAVELPPNSVLHARLGHARHARADC